MNKLPAGIRSTKPGPLPESNEADLKRTFNKKERDVYIHIWDGKDTVYSNQPGKFPVRLTRGYRYQMVMVHIDFNAVLAESMRNRSAAKMIRPYLALIAQVRRAGFVVTKHVLDNECSEELKKVIKERCKL